MVAAVTRSSGYVTDGGLQLIILPLTLADRNVWSLARYAARLRRTHAYLTLAVSVTDCNIS
jgi:hypothetical protein